jgi:hypothetical protein
MADGDKAEEGTNAPDTRRRGAFAVPVQGATTPPRESALIEGEAIKSETASKAEAASGDAPSHDASNAPGPNEPASETPLLEQHAAGSATDTSLAQESDQAQESEQARESEPLGRDAGPPDSTLAAAAPPRRRASLWPIAVAIVLGAGIAVGGAFGLHQFDKQQTSNALSARVKALEQEQTKEQARAREQTQSSQTASQPAAAEITALGQRVAALEAGAKATKSSLADVQQSVQQFAAQLKQSQQKFAAAAKTGAGTADLAPLTGRITSLDKQATAFDQKLSALGTKFDSALSNVQTDLANLRTDVGNLRTAKSADAQAALAQTQAASAGAQSALTYAEADARAILAADLRSKVEAGDDFADDLSALSSQGVDAAKLAPLRPFAASGVARPAALAAEFAALAPTLVKAKPEPKTDGFLARLARDAQHLVRIRKIGDTTGNDPAAQIARISAALSAGHLQDALREWQSLPPSAKAKSQAFGAALEHRIAALNAAKTIEAEALAGLAKAKS